MFFKWYTNIRHDIAEKWSTRSNASYIRNKEKSHYQFRGPKNGRIFKMR